MKENPTNKWGMLGAIGAGIVASACCTVPVALVSAGIGGSFIASFRAMEPYRPFFVVVAVTALALVALKEYRRSKEVDCDCEEEDAMSETRRRTILGAGFVVTLLLISSPWLLRGAMGEENSSTENLSGLSQVVLTVDGMTCELCDVTVAKALESLDGVEEAIVTFEPPQAIVRFNSSVVGISDMERVTADIGYPAKLKTGSL